MFDVKFDTGLFSKKLGEIDVRDTKGLSVEKQKEQVMRVVEELKNNGVML